MKRRYVLAPQAARDLVHIWRFIKDESTQQTADRVESVIRSKSVYLADFPQVGHWRRDLTAAEVRFLAVYSYLIVYRPETKPLQIVAILHAHRDLTKIPPKETEETGTGRYFSDCLRIVFASVFAQRRVAARGRQNREVSGLSGFSKPKTTSGNCETPKRLTWHHTAPRTLCHSAPNTHFWCRVISRSITASLTCVIVPSICRTVAGSRPGPSAKGSVIWLRRASR
jgi:plasmid stabilization system protein ParE